MKEKTTRNKKKTKKIIRTVIFWILIAAFLGWFASLRLKLENNPNTYDYVIPFESRALNEYRTASGKVVMNDIETVSTDVTQKIKKVYFRLGDHVEAGDVLCEFESEDLDKQIESLEKWINDQKSFENLENSSGDAAEAFGRKTLSLNVDNASAAVQAARKLYDDTYNKYSEYYDKCYTTSNEEEAAMYMQMYNQYLSQLEPINDQIRSAQKELDAARESLRKYDESRNDSKKVKELTASNLEEYEKQLEKLKNERENLVVTAPKSGVIADCFAFEGGYAFDGGLFRIGTLGKYKIEAFISDRDILDVKPGMKASFKTALTGADAISAKLVRISDIYSQADKGYAAELEITDESCMDKLRHNVITSAKIYTVDMGVLPAVQYDAVASDDNGNKYVYKAVKKNGSYTAEKVEVETGYESDFYVEVKSDALSDGDLIVGNASEHNEGDLLKVRGAKN